MKNKKINIAIVGGGLDSDVGYLHYCSLNIEQKFKVVSGCFSKKKKITISGDTKSCNNLMKYAQKADVLLHEVFIEGELKPFKRILSRKTLHNVRDYHTSSEDVGKIAKISKAKKLVLTHFVPPQFNEQRLINKVKIGNKYTN